MWKAIVAGTAALAIAGTTLVYAQQRGREPDTFLFDLADTEDPIGLGLFVPPPHVPRDEFIQTTFTLLRLSGTSTGALYRVVLLETASPLVMATLVAAVVGFVLATPVARALAPARHVFALPGTAYFATMGIGLVLAAGIVVACLPILNRVTQPDSARFE